MALGGKLARAPCLPPGPAGGLGEHRARRGGKGWEMPALSEDGVWQSCIPALSPRRGGEQSDQPKGKDHQPRERDHQPGKLGHQPGDMNCHSLQMRMQTEEGWGGKIKSRVQQWPWFAVPVEPHKSMFVNTLGVTNSLGALPFRGTRLGLSFRGDTVEVCEDHPRTQW